MPAVVSLQPAGAEEVCECVLMLRIHPQIIQTARCYEIHDEKYPKTSLSTPPVCMKGLSAQRM